MGLRGNLPAEAITAHLFDDGFVCAVRAGHPTVRGTVDARTFAALDHVLIAPSDDPGSPVDMQLERLGLARRVAVRTHTFLAAPMLVARTDLVLTGPRRVLVPMAETLGLRLFPPPVRLAPFAVHAAWHPRMQQDPAHAWLRTLVREAAATAAPARRSAKATGGRDAHDVRRRRARPGAPARGPRPSSS